ncbi:MAG: hypothetical protein NVS9B4_28230 [Candidatus Acidiferrum sp.]
MKPELRKVPAFISHLADTCIAHHENAAHDVGRIPSPCFTGEETIVLRALAAGDNCRQIGRDLRMPNGALFRILSDLRQKTGAIDDVALAVWSLRHSKSSERRRSAR